MMNVMLETSGKDIASFDCVNFFFRVTGIENGGVL